MPKRYVAFTVAMFLIPAVLVSLADDLGGVVISKKTINLGGDGVGPVAIEMPAEGLGCHVTVEVDDNGEAPSVRVVYIAELDTRLRVSVAFDGKEMWSTADIDTSGGLVLAPDSGDAKTYWSFTYQFPRTTRAYDADDVTVYVWAYYSGHDGAAIAPTSSDTHTIAFPGTIKHMIVQSASFDVGNQTSALYDEYVAAGATVYEYAPSGSDIVLASTLLDSTYWDAANLRYTNRMYTHAMQRTKLNPADGGGGSDPWMFMAYCPLEDLLPTDATVIDARFNYNAAASHYMGKADTMIVVMDTVATDSEWYQHFTTTFAHRGQSSWRYQVQGTDDCIGGNEATLTARGHGATSSHAWGPALRDREDLFDWGVFQWTSEQHPTRHYVGTGAQARWYDNDWTGYRIGRLVQAAHDGLTNNGFLFLITDSADSDNIQAIDFDAVSSVDHQYPFFTISYIDGVAYESPFDGTTPLIASFGSDDGHTASNDAWSAVSQAAGVKFTAYVNQNNFEDTGYFDADDLLRWRGRGVEIGAHSRFHWGELKDPGVGGWGIAEYDSSDFGKLRAGYDAWAIAFTDCDTTGYWAADIGMEAMLVDIDPCWIYDVMGSTYQLDRYVAKSMSLPNHGYNQTNLFGLLEAGYSSMRCGAADANLAVGTYGRYEHTYAYPKKPLGESIDADADSTLTGFSTHDLLTPVNLLGFARSIESNAIVGARATTLSEADLRALVKWQVIRHIGRERLILSWYAHDAKGDLGGGYPSGGMTPSEFEIVLDELANLGITVLCARDVADWKQARTVWIDTPTAWGQANVYEATVAEKLWAQMKWIDAATVQGVLRQGS